MMFFCYVCYESLDGCKYLLVMVIYFVKSVFSFDFPFQCDKVKTRIMRMNISISGHHISVTDAMKDAVMDKLSKVERRFDQIQSIKVILSLDNHHSETSHAGHQNHKAEALMRVAGQEMFVSVSQDDMYQAINEMAEKLDRQIRKYKTKIERKNRRNKQDRLQVHELEAITDMDDMMDYGIAV